MRHRSPRPVAAAGLLACGLALAVAVVPSVARACMVDSKPSASANGVLARLNPQLPQTAAQLAVWGPFIFPRSVAPRRAVTLAEDRKSIARVLAPQAMQHPWRWRFVDGTGRPSGHAVTYGWTVRHAFAHAGQWLVGVDAYDPATKRWYPFDQISIVVHR